MILSVEKQNVNTYLSEDIEMRKKKYGFCHICKVCDNECKVVSANGLNFTCFRYKKEV